MHQLVFIFLNFCLISKSLFLLFPSNYSYILFLFFPSIIKSNSLLIEVSLKTPFFQIYEIILVISFVTLTSTKTLDKHIFEIKQISQLTHNDQSTSLKKKNLIENDGAKRGHWIEKKIIYAWIRSFTSFK